MQINKEVLKSLNPCADRYKHFLKHHGEFNGSFSDFLDLPNVAYSDKVWVVEKVLTQNQLVKWSVLCADSVVHIFEVKYPKDKRISNCIDFLKTVNDFDNLTYAQVLEVRGHIDYTNSAHFTAHYTAKDAGEDADSAAVRAARAAYAAHAAVYAANSAYLANAAYAASVSEGAYAAAYTTKYAIDAARFAFHAAKNAGEDADAAQENQKALNLQFLKQVTSL